MGWAWISDKRKYRPAVVLTDQHSLSGDLGAYCKASIAGTTGVPWDLRINESVSPCPQAIWSCAWSLF